MLNKNKRYGVCFFVILIITSPVLSMYEIFKGISIFDSFMVAFFLLMCFNRKINISGNSIYKNIWPFCIYVYINMLLNINGMQTKEILAQIKYGFYLLVMLVMVKDFFNYKFAVKVYKFVSVFATYYLILQLIVYYFYGKYLTGFLNLNFVNTEQNAIAFGIEFFNEIKDRFRFYAFFSEPAWYAMFCSGYLLLSCEERPCEKLTRPLLIFGIICSKSNVGFFSIIFIYLMYWLSHKTKQIVKYFVWLLFLFVFFVFIDKSGYLFQISNRFGQSFAGRFNGYGDFIKIINNFSFAELMFGVGIIKYQSYLTGYLRLFISFGIVGFFIFLYTIYLIYAKGDKTTKQMLLYLIVLNIGTEIFMGVYFLLYMSFILKMIELKRIRVSCQ